MPMIREYMIIWYLGSLSVALGGAGNHLLVSAGSDYHGKNKLIAIGETGLGPETELPAGMRRFLKDVNYDRSET